MTRILQCFSVILLMLLSPWLATAQEAPSFSEKARSWEQSLTKAEKEIDAARMSDAEYGVLQEELRKLRSDALSEAGTQQARLEKQRELLAALGVAPEKASDEDPQVAAKREALDVEIKEIDARLKQANLISAKAESQLSAIDAVMKEELRAELLTYEAIPATPEALMGLLDQANDYMSDFEQWTSFALFVAGLLFLSCMAFPLTRNLNQLIHEAPGIEAHEPFSRVRLMVLLIAGYAVFLMRFGMVNIERIPALENLIEAAASICLAVVLFFALGKVHFIVPQRIDDALGERKANYSWLWNGFRTLARIITLLVPVASLAGYANLGVYVIFNMLMTIGALLLFIWMRKASVRLYLMLLQSKNVSESSSEEQLSPIAITFIEPVLAVVSLSVAFFFWGMTSDDVTGFIARYQNGIPIGDVTLDFTNLFSGVLLFAGLFLVTRLMQWFLSARVFPYTDFNIGVRDAILAISGYAGVTIAFLVSVSAVGLDLSNLAIVAGALSVGIGFGLQAIFNNFVSGLILLFERPIKVGDWVIVGTHEGVVKKIRVRSTEIETFWNSTVIVPNSQLISEAVTNWTLHDRVGRVDVGVGVAYGSDTEKVKEVLLAVAKDHPQVRSIPEPLVLFQNFGDSSLDFELRCFIHNIRDVFRVRSQLRFAIDAAFREHHITIPFPQRDLHIVSPESISVMSADAKVKKDA